MESERAAPEESTKQNAVEGIGYFGSLLHVLKSVIGTGIFAMGDAVCNAGLVGAPIALLALSVISLHCTHLLLKRSEEMRRVTEICSPSFADTAEFVFKTGPPKVHRFSSGAKISINVCLCILQIGTCCVYLEFVAANMKHVLDESWEQDIRIHLLVWSVPILLSCWILNLTYLLPVTLCANVCESVGLLVILVYICRVLPSSADRNYVASWARWPLFFGTATFAFEINSLALTLQCAMKKPEQFSSTFGVINVGLAINVVLLITTGILGYIKYGDEVEGSLTLNMPKMDVLTPIMQVTLSIATMFSYPLQMYVPVSIIWPVVRKRWGPWRSEACAEIAFRTALVLTTLVIAEAITRLDLVISLVGAVGSTAVTLVIPAMLDLVAHWQTGLGTCYWLIWKDGTIFLVGILAMSTGLYSSVYGIFYS